MKYFKSPMNYIGNKYKLLPQILPLFPKNIDIFIDLFCGGLDVSLNVESQIKICNDKEKHIIDLYQNLLKRNGAEVNTQILEVIKKYNLSLINAEGYNSLRCDYNQNLDWLLFYCLIAYSFNHQFRYNNEGLFNMPFGRNRSQYNASLQERFQIFVDMIDNNYSFENKDFRNFDFNSSNLTKNSFVYVDPPYLITTATYNEKNGWNKKDEKDLLNLLDNLNEKGLKFGLSNVLRQNDKENKLLLDWCNKYSVHHLNFNYNNSSYHRKDRSIDKTDEVFICNY